MKGQLSRLGTGRNGKHTAANSVAHVVTSTVVSSLSLPLLTTAFQMA